MFHFCNVSLSQVCDLHFHHPLFQCVYLSLFPFNVVSPHLVRCSKPPFIICFQGNILNSKKSQRIPSCKPPFIQQKSQVFPTESLWPLRPPPTSQDRRMGPMITSMTPSCGSSVNSTVPQIALLAASCTVKRVDGNVGEIKFGTRKGDIIYCIYM